MHFPKIFGLILISIFLSPIFLHFSASAATSELFFSEYIEGNSNNKALEIYNGTGSSVNLASDGYRVAMYFNGSMTAGLIINLTGTLMNGDVFVLANSSAEAAILAQADQTEGSGWYNGDDAVLLLKGATVIDAIGQVGVDPGSEWGSGLVSTGDNTLRRKTDICAGDTIESDTFDPSIEWDGFPINTFDGLGTHTANCGSSEASIPTLNEWGLIMMGLLFAGATLFMIRKQQRNN